MAVVGVVEAPRLQARKMRNRAPTVVLWADFFGNLAGGHPTPLAEQEVTLIHEFIHSYYNISGPDSGITSKFKIGVKTGQSFADAVDAWIRNNCGKK